MMQLMQFQKESLKKFRLVGIETLTSAIPVHRLNKLSYKATGSWSLIWFVKHPGKMPMKWWIFESNVLELWNEETNAYKIIAVKDATYAVAERKPKKIQACQDSIPDLCGTSAML